MIVAITGASGFVGSHLAERLSSEGHEVIYDLVPTRRFTPEQIRNGLPHPAPFCIGDLRLCS
jgi:nucleoside-diphosphate-sugar epimerase